jgi:hypothetical protein
MAGLDILKRDLARMFGATVRDNVARDLHKNRKVTFTDVGKDSRRYLEYVNGKGQTVRFYRACHRNIAGYFIIWRETVMKNGTIKNDMIRAFKSKSAAMKANRARHAKATAK